MGAGRNSLVSSGAGTEVGSCEFSPAPGEVNAAFSREGTKLGLW